MKKLIKYFDKKFKFMEIFNRNTGFYVRTGVLEEEDGKIIDTNIDPFMRSFAGLLDIGIMGHCIHGKSGLCIKSGVQCYQNGLHTHHSNMSLENYKKIINQCKDKVYQVALGGRGDVDQHENFEDIMKYTRENGIVPNFTSSGLGFNEEIINICKQYAGAIAISWYRQEHTLKAIDMLLKAGIKTNIHYVLGNNSIDEAIDKLKNNSFPKGINAVVFLLHKPVGLGKETNVLDVNDPKVKEFYDLIDQVMKEQTVDFKIGFDSCNVPGILNFNKNIDANSIDTCEAARYSAYITSDMKMLPCSFDNQDLKWSVDIDKYSLQEAWDSEQFENFRTHFLNSCPSCKDRLNCYGGCPIKTQITLCNRKEKDLYNAR